MRKLADDGLGLTFEQRGYRAGDTVECKGTDNWTNGPKVGDLFQIVSTGSALKIRFQSSFYYGTMAKWQLVGNNTLSDPVGDKTPTRFWDMSDADKGKLLLATHNDQELEMYHPTTTNAYSFWSTVSAEHRLRKDRCYRVKPTPRVKTHSLYGSAKTNTWNCVKAPFDTHMMSYVSYDDEIDCKSIRMGDYTQ